MTSVIVARQIDLCEQQHGRPSLSSAERMWIHMLWADDDFDEFYGRFLASCSRDET